MASHAAQHQRLEQIANSLLWLSAFGKLPTTATIACSATGAAKIRTAAVLPKPAVTLRRPASSKSFLERGRLIAASAGRVSRSPLSCCSERESLAWQSARLQCHDLATVQSLVPAARKPALYGAQALTANRQIVAAQTHAEAQESKAGAINLFDLSPAGLQALISNLEHSSLQSHSCYDNITGVSQRSCLPCAAYVPHCYGKHHLGQ